jgi:predicted NAD-dependent protein-ADP-ribosyltransferase YbiA (DUF1768 family)
MAVLWAQEGGAGRRCEGEAAYPSHWWAPADRGSAPKWEILPQDAPCGSVVLSKRNELGVFSNLAQTPFSLDQVRFQSIEGLWQMMKYPEGPMDPRSKDADLSWRYKRNEVADLFGFEAKTAGDLANENMKKLGIRWVTYKGETIEYKGKDQNRHLEIITAAIQAKVRENQSVRALLMATGELVLLPDHTQEGVVPPAYRYFEILMKIRSDLRSANSDHL